jgi:choloylglycine hydrolase
MDGINEKGLFVSIMKLDIKEGEQPGRFSDAASMLVRYMLDDCADVEEAVAKVNTAIVTPEDWQGCHVFVTDAEDHYALIESRNSVVSVIPSDVCTNFYLAYDDIEDSYRDGILREDAVKMTDENLATNDHYGYGHGYHRFVILQSQLERCQDAAKKERYTVMPESMALALLQVTAQNPFTDASGVSMTQYSAIYNIRQKTVEVWPFQNYSKSFAFDVTGKQIPAA